MVKIAQLTMSGLFWNELALKQKPNTTYIEKSVWYNYEIIVCLECVIKRLHSVKSG